ncbi:DUF3971 domain-containing protein [Zhengella sp. ZM62]|uniref:YhdP family protein n=1 Tax=Zhengella sedimenti TaxID=3390035 RepID=UPI003975982C
MDQDRAHAQHGHARVRFRRRELPALDALPSSAGLTAQTARFYRAWKVLRWIGGGVAAAGLVVLLALSGAWVAINAGVGAERISREAETALARLYGFPVNVSLGDTRLSFANGINLAFEIGDVDVRQADTGQSVTSAKAVKLGIGSWALLNGRLQLASLSIAGAHAAAGMKAPDPQGDFLQPVRDAEGLVDPDRVLALVFESVRAALKRLDATGTSRISLDETQVTYDGMRIAIAEADLRHALNGTFEASGVIDFAGTPVTLEASGRQVGDAITALAAEIRTGGIDLQGAAAAPALSVPDLEIALEGGETHAGAGQALRMRLRAPAYSATVETPGDLKGSLMLTADLASGSRKVDIPEALLQVNRTRIPFSGAAGPRPPAEDEEPAWRYELVSNDVFLAPMDSPEPGLKLGARIAGVYRPGSNSLEASSLAVRTAGGEVLGSATAVFGEGETPAVFLAIRSDRLPVSHAKQLWPWLSAPNPRRWVMDNLFDGVLTNTELELSAGPGRLTDGLPFDADEIHGHFEVAGTRFDVAGEIPPIRDATGVIDFAGNDVTITLSEGTGFMENGRKVKGTNGVLTFRDTHINPVIGRLKIDIEGDAPSIVELASREPINAGERLGFSPDKLSGSVTGVVETDIPVDKDTDIATLDWRVDLAFEDLAIDHEFDGQRLTEADGKAVIDPASARIEARGRLNGIEADLSLVEPLDGDDPTQVDVALLLDDKARNDLAPGLAEILSGPVAVKVSGPSERRTVEAKLDDAVLSVPWMGWSKGKGVPATARFVLETDGNRARVRDLSVEGASFALAGNVELSSGDLVSATFSRVRLNRGDDFSARLTRQRKGLSIDIEGEAMDARALVKALQDSETATAAGAGQTQVAVTARLDRVTGFSGEVLSKLRLDYSGKGNEPASASLTAVARSGSAVEVRHNGGTNRALEIRTGDAGAILRFLDIYERMQGGVLAVALKGTGNGPLSGQVDVRDFWLVNEPRLASLVSTPAPQSDGRSLSDAVRSDIDTSRVRFDRGFALISKGEKSLTMQRGVLRGPLIGTTFQGTLYDGKGNMSVTGTFMPAYGLNKIFGEIPVLGYVLGNGRDRGLIGITYKLSGEAKSPKLQINPISAIAPGIFRSIFEFR